MDEPEARRLLPADQAARLQAVRKGRAGTTIVLDGTGLDADGRTALETGVREALGGASAGPLRIAVVADRAGAPRRIAIASGKGGVGKSTLTANLAVALAATGRAVGVVDADIYGPSQPVLLGVAGQKLEARDQQLLPLTGAGGVQVLSVGNLVDPDKALAWRGPMATGALSQLAEGDWSGTELLLFDLPPGTGDIQLTLIQKFRPDVAVVISTPQDLALIDAARAVQLFAQTRVPVAGVVENMAGYMCPHCGEVSDPFGRGGVEAAAAELGVPFLGRIPLTMALREASDAGTPLALGSGPEAGAFAALAQRLLAHLAQA